MITHRKLKYSISHNGLDYYNFQPTFNNWFFRDWPGYVEDSEKRTKRQWMRMLLEWIFGGYCMYYAAQQDQLVGYILVATGGRRITCSDQDDIVLGPYYTLKI